MQRGSKALILALLCGLGACGNADEREGDVATTQDALSTVDRVLSFEQVASDWSVAPGSGSSAFASTSQHTDGTHAGSLSNLGWAQVQSVRIGPLGQTSTSARFDVLIAGTGTLPWGDVILQVDAPSAGLFSQQVGQKLLGGTARGAFQAVVMPLSTDLVSKLSSGTLTDLSVRLTANLPSGSSVVFDHLSFGQQSVGSGGAGAGGGAGSAGTAGNAHAGAGAGSIGVGGTLSRGGGAGNAQSGASLGGATGIAGQASTGAAGSSGTGGSAGTAGSSGTGGSAGTAEEFFLEIAANLQPSEVVLGSYRGGGGLVINDGVKLVEGAAGFSNASSVLTATHTDLGVGTELKNLWSTADVWVRGSHVHGDITTAGLLAPSPQVTSVIDGATRQRTSVNPILRQSWSVAFPANQGPVTLAQFEEKTITPGAYGEVTLNENAHLSLNGAGIYTFDGSLTLEPGSVLSVQNSDHQVELYVRKNFFYRGAIQKAVERPNVVIGVAGVGDVPIDRPLDAILIAPNGNVQLGTTAVGHRTSVYAASILARPNTVITHDRFDPAQLCGPGAPRGGLCKRDCMVDSDCTAGLTCQSGVCGCASGTGQCGAREPCQQSSDCLPGLTCGIAQGGRYGVPWPNVCMPSSCSLHGSDGPDCGSVNAACGVCPACATASCTPFAASQFRAPDPANQVPGTTEGSFGVSDSGTATYSIQIQLPPGRADMTPGLALVYDSSGRQELLGEGWQLSGFSYITRCNAGAPPAGSRVATPFSSKRRGIRTGEGDALCLDGQQLARQPALDDDGQGESYATANESFKRIRAFGGTGSDVQFFKVWTPEGRIMTYGTPDSSVGTVLLNLKTGEKRVWALTRVEDQLGNYIAYSYGKNEGGPDNRGSTDPDGVCAQSPSQCGTSEIWPERIDYTGFAERAPTRSVQFVYDTDQLEEPIAGYVAGIQSTRTRLLNRIDISINTQVTQSYLIENVKAAGNVREVKRIWQCFPEHDDSNDPSSPVHDECKKPTEFDYFSEVGLGPAVDTGVTLHPSPESAPESQFVVWDVDSDGQDDLLTAQLDPIGLWGRWTQLFSQPGSNQLIKIDRPYYQFRGANSVATINSIDPRTIWREYAQSGIMDVDSDGHDDLMDTSPRGQQEGEALKGGTVFGALVHTSSLASGLPPLAFPDLSEAQFAGSEVPTISFIDVDGDGYADAVGSATVSGSLQWRRNVGHSSFTAAQTLASDANFLFPIDADGDGTLDLITQALNPATKQGKIASWDGTPNLPFFQMTRGKDVDFVGTIPPDILQIDINGDGLKDILVRGMGSPNLFSTAPVTLYTNTGRGFVQSGAVRSMDHREFESIKVLDYDGDGRDDALMWAEGSWVVLRGLEGQFQEMAPSSLLTVPGLFEYRRPTTSDLPTGETYVWDAVADLNGDGAQDLVVLDASSRLKIHFGNTALVHMLKTVTDGVGERVEVQYDGDNGQHAYARFPTPTNNETNAHILNRVGRPLVKRALVSRKEGTTFVLDHGMAYTNNDALVDYSGRGWLGFARRTIANFDANGATTDLTTISYEQNSVISGGPPICLDLPCGAPPTVDSEPYRYPHAGFPTKIETEFLPVAAGHSVDGSRHTKKVVENVWWTIGLAETPGATFPSTTGRTEFPSLRSRTTTELDLAQSATSPRQLSRIEETFQPDAAGNVTQHEVWTFKGTDRVEHTVEQMSFKPPDTTLWLLRVPSAVTVTRTRGRTIGPEINEFTGEATKRSVNYTHNTLGYLTEIKRAGSQITTTDLTRNQYGNVERVDRFGDGETTRTTHVETWDADDIFPRVVTMQPDAASEGEAGDPPLVPHTSTQIYDPRFGTLTSVVDSNSLEETWQYDGFGKLVHHQRPEGSAETITYTESSLDETGVLRVPAVFATTTTLDGGGQTTEEIDSLGREVRTTSLSIGSVPDSGSASHVQVVQEFGYDSQGRLQEVARPHSQGDTSQGIIDYTYNDADELTAVSNPDGTGDHRPCRSGGAHH